MWGWRAVTEVACRLGFGLCCFLSWIVGIRNCLGMGFVFIYVNVRVRGYSV